MASAPPQPPVVETIRDAPTEGMLRGGAQRVQGTQGDAWWGVVGQNASALAYDAITALNLQGPPDPDFNPMGKFEGYEEYARQFMAVQNDLELDRLKAQIDEAEAARALAAQELSGLGLLSTELLNPANLLPVPFIRGAKGLGALRGAARGSAGTATVLAGEEAVRAFLDPTATAGEVAMSVAFGGLLGGTFGGVIGATGARTNAQLARMAKADALRRSGEMSNEEFEAVVAPMMGLADDGKFHVEPTSGEVGVAKAFGLEAQTRITVFGQLKATGVQAVQDFSDIMLGDFNTMNASNFSGKATAQSIKLNVDTQWKARSLGVVQELQSVYGTMLRNGEAGRTVVGVDPRVLAQKAKEAISQTKPSTQPRFDEFKREVFEAYLKGNSDNPYVLQGVQKMKEFFNFAQRRMEQSGTLPTKQSFGARADRKATSAREAYAQYESAKTGAERAALGRKLSNSFSALARMVDQSVAQIDGLEGIVAQARKNLVKRYRTTSDPVANRKMLDEETVKLLEAKRSLTPDEVDFLNDLKAGLAEIGDEAPAMSVEALAPMPESMIGKNAKETLQNISRSSSIPSHRALARQLSRLVGKDIEILVAKSNASFKASTGQANAHAMAQYGGSVGNRIVLNASKGKHGLTEVALLHEAIHIAAFERIGMLGRINASVKQGKEIRAGIEELRELQRFARETMDADFVAKNSKQNFPLENIDEFLAWGMTDPRFRAEMEKVKLKNGGSEVAEGVAELNGWQRFVNAVRKVIGLDPKYSETIERIISTDTLAGKFDSAAARFMKDLEAAPRRDGEVGSAPLEAQRDYLQVMADRAKKYAGDFDQKRFGGEAYLPRFWLIDKIMADEAGAQVLRGKLERHYARGGLVTDEVRARVDDSINQITQQAEMGEVQMFAPSRGTTASFMRQRKIDIPNSEVLDFIETDVDRIMGSYAERAGTIDEINRIFGDPDAQGAIDDILVQAAREGMGPQDLGKLSEQLELARDKRTEAVYSMEPHLVNKRRIASAIRAYGSVAFLGKAAISAIPEIARTVMAHGFARTFGAIAENAFGKNPAFDQSWQLLPQLTGKGLDALTSGSLNRLVEQGGPTGAAAGGAGRVVQRGVDFASGPAFLINLLSPMTDMTKRMSQTFTHQFMLEDVVKIAEGTADQKTIARMASYGIDERMAERIANQPFEMSDDWFLPNMREWPDEEASRAFLGAVSGMTDNLTPTASLADVPEIAKGFVAGREYPLLVLPFQFMSYGFSVSNRVLLSGLQGRDADAMMGIAAMIGLGYVSQYIKSDENYWASMSDTERAIRAVDAAGIAGIYSDVNTTLETLTGNTLGVRPLLGADPFLGNQSAMEAAGGFAGPAGDMVVDVAKLISGEEMSSREMAATARGLLPFQNLFYLDGLWDRLQAWAGAPDTVQEGTAQ
jgi:hypothetical protein